MAVQMLSVTVPAETAIGLPECELGGRIGELPAAIPTDVELGTDNALG